MLWDLAGLPRSAGEIVAGSRSRGSGNTIETETETPSHAHPVAPLAFENLPEGSWVSWRNPLGPDRRWLHHSRDAWRWLGWHAPTPDGKGWTLYPMEAFKP